MDAEMAASAPMAVEPPGYAGEDGPALLTIIARESGYSPITRSVRPITICNHFAWWASCREALKLDALNFATPTHAAKTHWQFDRSLRAARMCWHRRLHPGQPYPASLSTPVRPSNGVFMGSTLDAGGT